MNLKTQQGRLKKKIDSEDNKEKIMKIIDVKSKWEKIIMKLWTSWGKKRPKIKRLKNYIDNYFSNWMIDYVNELMIKVYVPSQT